MTLQLSTAIRNAAVDLIESTIGASPTLTIRTGPPPANAAAADTGTVLATIALPADWLTAASNGSKSMVGSWADAAADASGDAGHFRISQGGTTHLQGTVSITGHGGDMQFERLAFVAGESVAVTFFTITAGGA